jgi:hypothetical protein
VLLQSGLELPAAIRAVPEDLAPLAVTGLAVGLLAVGLLAVGLLGVRLPPEAVETPDSVIVGPW